MFLRYSPVRNRLSALPAASAIDWPNAVSEIPATGEVSTWMVALTASFAGLLNEDAAAENSLGIVTTAA